MAKEKKANPVPVKKEKESKEEFSFLVKIRDLHKHYYEVNLMIESDKEEIDLVLPAWTPGSYMIRDYSTHLHKFGAIHSKTKEPVRLEQTDLNHWKIFSEGKSVTVSYIIYAFEDYTVRTNYLDTEFGFINPAGFFLYPENGLSQPVEIQFQVSDIFSNVYTSLSKNNSLHSFHANDFDELFDSPFHLTNKNSVFFEAGSCQHELLIEGDVPYSFKEKLANDLKRITSTEIAWMGDNPNPYYLFVLNLSQNAYGGLEHRASSINFFSPDQIHDEEEYKRLLELLAHEYFHLWNIKRIRPIALGPFDYQKPNLTKELWIAEGITSFYDIYFLYLSGFITKEDYLTKIQADIFALDETNAEEWMSLEESSFTAWNKFYKRNANSHNLNISYYTKGGILVLCMELFIRKETAGLNSFQNIMQALYKKFYIEKKRGFTKQEFFDTALETTGVDLKTEFDTYLTKPVRIPVEEYLKWIGVFRTDSDFSSDLGFRVKEKNGNVFVQKILHGKDTATPDIQLEDEIIAINGKRVNFSGFQKLEKQFQPKEKIVILLSRYGKTKEILIEVGGSYKNKKLSFSSIIPTEIKQIQNSFFGVS
ncbi:peptidase [Leptospira kobayashii]|uniref:Peptidase n=1 Tax=Leptospira kobayashii TaxID=1917830 RepID=A0ABM7UP15_9LEPT|nr:PDZ domain-containing protein [Leptospira kobayashii]BDA80920.1 peptidase [Leptospira kobayashii]